MPNYNHSLKTPLSQEVENPSSFDFSIPIPDESPSTPVCGGGEMVESITPQTEVVASPVSHSDKVLVCSPTLVLSDEKSRSSEAQSVAKPSAEPFSEETESMNTRPVVKVLYSCKSCPCQGVGEAAEYFTNQKRRGFVSLVERNISNLCESLYELG
uniref:Uncharacterized protein n=1 Tax=Solanum tuberosum TaxID=4113 RepID=M1DA46_SOLTU